MKVRPKKKRKVTLSELAAHNARMSKMRQRPPARVYVTFDDLGPHIARDRLKDSASDAECEADMFGDAWIYEYKLVDKRVRRKVLAEPPQEPKGKFRGVKINFVDPK